MSEIVAAVSGRFVGDVDLSAYRYRLAQKGSAAGHCAIGTTTGTIIGVLAEVTDNDRVLVIRVGRCYLTAAGAIAAGADLVPSGTAGKVAASAGSGLQLVGRALTAAAQDGDVILAEIIVGEAMADDRTCRLMTAGADLRAALNCPVKETAAGVCALATASTDLICGFLLSIANTNGTVIVKTRGVVTYVPATSAPTLGQEVMASTLGVMAAAAGSGANVWIAGQVTDATNSLLRITGGWKWFAGA